MMKNVIILIITLIISACECVEDVNTPKIINPDKSANVSFINMTDTHKSLAVFSNDILVSDKVIYGSDGFSFSKVASGTTYIKINDSESDVGLLNFSADFEQDKYYTVIVYSLDSQLIPMLIYEEDFQNYDYALRLINLTEVLDRRINFMINDIEIIYTLESGQYSDIINLQNSTLRIRAFDELNGSFIGEKESEASKYVISFLIGNSVLSSEFSIKLFNN